MARKKRGRASRNTRQKQGPQVEEEYKKAPHTFVINRGHVGKNVSDLVMDIRRVMEPYTASKLHVRKKNVLKDFIHLAGPLNVTHFILLSKTEKSVNLRLVKVPQGPTLTFRVERYSLCRDVVSSIRKAHMEEGQFNHHPLLVMNGFSRQGMHLKLMTTMFQNMFPSLNINKIKLSSVRRCVLINYLADTKTVEFRHYNITAVPVGISKGLKKLMKPSLPSMARYDDISEYFMRGGNLSESEAEPNESQNEVILPQKMSGRGNIKSNKSAVRLTEIGPRLTLQLIKIEENVCEGDILYHGFISKTDKELAEIRKRRLEKKKLKQERRKQQEDNVKKKMEKKENLKQKCLAGMKEVEDPGREADEEKSDSDDAEYFQQEVGVAPDSDLLLTQKQKPKKEKRKMQKEDEISPSKKRKLDKLAEEKERTKEFINKMLMKKKKLAKKKEKKLKSKGSGGPKKNKPKKKEKYTHTQEHDKDLNVKKSNVVRNANTSKLNNVKKGKFGSKFLGVSAKKGFTTHSKKK